MRASHTSPPWAFISSVPARKTGPPRDAGSGVGDPLPGQRGPTRPHLPPCQVLCRAAARKSANGSPFSQMGHGRPKVKNFHSTEIFHGRVRERALGVFKFWFPCTFVSADVERMSSQNRALRSYRSRMIFGAVWDQDMVSALDMPGLWSSRCDPGDLSMVKAVRPSTP